MICAIAHPVRVEGATRSLHPRALTSRRVTRNHNDPRILTLPDELGPANDIV